MLLRVPSAPPWFQPEGLIIPLTWGFIPCITRALKGPGVTSGLLGVWLKQRFFAGSGDDLGECPEWQRGRTVNPLRYRFEGSSPSSPTIA